MVVSITISAVVSSEFGHRFQFCFRLGHRLRAAIAAFRSGGSSLRPFPQAPEGACCARPSRTAPVFGAARFVRALWDARPCGTGAWGMARRLLSLYWEGLVLFLKEETAVVLRGPRSDCEAPPILPSNLADGDGSQRWLLRRQIRGAFAFAFTLMWIGPRLGRRSTAGTGGGNAGRMGRQRAALVCALHGGH